MNKRNSLNKRYETQKVNFHQVKEFPHVKTMNNS